MYFQPTHNTHPTYPADSVIKFIDEKIRTQMDVDEVEPVVTKAKLLTRDPYINCRVRKKFGKKFYEGTVDYAWFNKDKVVYYHVIYDDTETHDYTEAELGIIVISEPSSSLNNTVVQSVSAAKQLDDDSLSDYYTINYANQFSLFIPEDAEAYYEDDVYGIFASTHEVHSTIAIPQGQSREVPIHKAFKEDRDKWQPIVHQLVSTHLNDLHSIVLCRLRDIPYDAKIFPSTILCKEGKVDTSKIGEHRKNDARLVVQDSRSVHSPADVYSSVASAKAIKIVLGIAAHNGMKPQIRDIVKAFPNTPLPQELKGKIFIRLPKELGYSSDTYAMLNNAVEGYKLSNHIYEDNIHEGFIEHGFKTVPNDDQLIFKVEDDGNFIWAVKVVDNILSIATSQHLHEQLVTSMEGSGYTVKNEAPDKFIGMQLEWNALGDLLLHQERHEEKLLIKYDITKTASTPLPSNFSHTNYLTSQESESIDITSYQRLVGDIIYLSLTNTAIPYANSAVAQKTQYCTQRDYDAAIHILCYINGHRKQGLIFRRAPEWQRPLRLTDVLDMPISIYFSCDGAHNAITQLVNPQDQSGYYIKLYSWYTASVECISKAQRITLSSTEAEVASMVLALRSSLNIFHTSTHELTSNALTKRVTAEEQQWSTDDIRGLHHHEVPTTRIRSVPIRRRDHMELWPVIPCSSTNP